MSTTAECQCPHHPFGCYGHPDKCNCVSPSPVSPADDVVGPLEIAQRGFQAWAAKPHNAKWARKIDDTPIPNDLVVCIAEQFIAALSRLQARLAEVTAERDMARKERAEFAIDSAAQAYKKLEAQDGEANVRTALAAAEASAATMREALTELVETIKTHRLNIIAGLTKHELGELQEALHKANVAALGGQHG